MGRVTVRKVARVGIINPSRPIKPMRVGRVSGGTRGVQLQLDLMPEDMRAAAARIGTDRAREVQELRDRGIEGSLPELCTYEWLERRKLAFDFQSAQMGGRRVRGGTVVDFIIYGLSGNGVYQWRVQGDYWHSSRESARNDAELARRLRRLKIGGEPVAAVVDLWESDIYDRYPRVFQLAEFGEGLR